jgi:hypothetical protein
MADKSNFYWISQMSSQRDPIRTTHWRLRVNTAAIKTAMGNPSILSDITNDQDLSVLVKTGTIPKVVVQTADSFFMGQKMAFATNTEFDTELDWEIQETSDLKAFRFFALWNQYVHNVGALTIDTPSTAAIDPTATNGMGVNLGSGKFTQTDFPNSVVRNNDTIWLELYDYTQGVVLWRCSFVNFFPKSVGGISLSHESPALAKWTMTSHQDYYNFVVPSKLGSMGNGM